MIWFGNRLEEGKIVDYSKYRDLNYYPRAATPEYRPEFIDDELHKISHAIDKYAQEYYPVKNASVHTVSYTATIFDDVLLCTGPITITLYDAAGKTENNVAQNAGRRIVIKKVAGGNVTIDAAGTQTIDGALTQTITASFGSL